MSRLIAPYFRRTATTAAVLFVLPVASLFAQGAATRNAAPVAKVKRSGTPFEAKFVDVAAPSGLSSPLTYGDPKTKSYIMEVNGAGIAFIDFDDDGRLDIFTVNGSQFGDAPNEAVSRLYRNMPDGKFVDVTAEAGVGRKGWGAGVCAGDYDNDGATDLYVAYWGPNALYHNLGDGRFEDLARRLKAAGGEKEWTSGCTFVDYDRDGDLDLLTTQYQQFDAAKTPKAGSSSTCQWKGMPVFCGPRGLPYGGATLLRNDGAGGFKDVTAEAGVADVAGGYYAFTADYNSDGAVDVYVACDSTPNLLYVNDGEGMFTDFATETGLAFNEHGHEQGGMGIAVGDYDRDGLLDVIKTNFAGDYPNVYHNLGDGVFEDVVVRAGLASNPQFVGWGVGLVDLDNDGLQDVFQVNGHVYPELDDPTVKNSEEYRQPAVIYRNLGGGKFEDVSDLAGAAIAAKRSSRGAAFGDFDNDGDIDVAVLNMGEAPSLFRNDLASKRHWIRVKLEGRISNRDAIGAVVRVKTGVVEQTRAILSQDSYISHSDLRAHFGLGQAQKVDGFTVVWPNGKTETFPGSAVDRDVLLVEGSGEVAAIQR